MVPTPRIVTTATAQPPYRYSQSVLLTKLCSLAFGSGWEDRPDMRERVALLARLFDSSGVEQRRTAVDLTTYYDRPRSTGERMAEYQRSAFPLARTALAACLAAREPFMASAVTDLIVVSCTGYRAPGLDILLARDLALPDSVRRLTIGHMGCYGALVGLRQSLAALRAHRQSLVALLAVELCSLHQFPAVEGLEVLTSYALFADGVAAVLLSADPQASGPELVNCVCITVVEAMHQMSWSITDEGFVMGLSSRVPITLRKHVRAGVQRLLAPHGLAEAAVTHWLIHPGGPSILDVVQERLQLRDEQLAVSRQTLREHGNCSSSTVLIMLDALLRSGTTNSGEWGVIMAFGPGLTLELCLLRF